MQYLLLIHASEVDMGDLAAQDVGKIMGAMDAFDKEITAAGQNIGSIRLQPSAKTKTIKVRKGKVLATDGPFAETKEHLGGIYIIEAKDQQEAAAIAARLPTAPFTTIEVRPVEGIDLRKAVQNY
ncbi:MAG: YciI family protein [Chloroflexi bacterium]|nr:YciI family protein [Chloroflexota bacterium]